LVEQAVAGDVPTCGVTAVSATMVWVCIRLPHAYGEHQQNHRRRKGCRVEADHHVMVRKLVP